MALDPFFAVPADATGQGEAAGAYFDDCKITPIIDAADYNAAVARELKAMNSGSNGETILLANWWLGLLGGDVATFTVDGTKLASATGTTIKPEGPYDLDPPNMTYLMDLLKLKARAGVDVRVLGWASAALMSSDELMRRNVPIASLNSASLLSISDLRKEPMIGSKAIVNIANHPAASSHLKMMIFMSNARAVGFVGGLDFEASRFAHSNHPGTEFWHDIVAQVEGSAVQAMYDWFRIIWMQNLALPPHGFVLNGAPLFSRVAVAGAGLSVTPDLPVHMLTTPDPGTKHSVQVSRTAPAFALATLAPNPTWFNGFDAFPTGCFEVAVGWRKAISQARKYVYIEDQSFSSVDVMGWLNEALKRNADLRVVMLSPGGADPHDAPSDVGPAILARSINRTLLAGLDVADWDRVRFFRRFGEVAHSYSIKIGTVTRIDDYVRLTTDWAPPSEVARDVLVGWQLVSGPDHFAVVANAARSAGTGTVTLDVAPLSGRLPGIGAATLDLRVPITVHSKVTIIDDHWAQIGTANCMTRSLWSDDECAVSFVDQAGTAVRDFRALLWSQHFQAAVTDMTDVDTALKAWADSWGAPGPSAVARPGTLQEVLVPVRPALLTDSQREEDRTVNDVDSRQTWDYLPLVWNKLITTKRSGGAP